MKDSQHGPLVCCPSILQPEQHHCVVKVSERCFERCFLGILTIDLDLIVASNQPTCLCLVMENRLLDMPC